MLLITDKFGIYIIFIMFFIALFYFSLYISINLLIGFFKAINDKLYMTSYDLGVKTISVFTFMSALLFFSYNIIEKMPDEQFELFYNCFILLGVTLYLLCFIIKFIIWIINKASKSSKSKKVNNNSNRAN